MKKNVASQVVGAQLIAKADGSPVTSGTTTVYYTLDGGTQTQGSVGSGAATHKGNGYWVYSPAQGETNGDLAAFTFVNTNAVNATVQIYTSFPQTGDNYPRLGAPAGASVSADVAAIKSDTGAVKTKTDFLPSATAGSSGGVFIAGSNAATTVDITGSLSGSVGSVIGAVGSVTGNVGGNVAGSIGSLATQAKADVNAEVDQAISDAALATAANLATVDSVADAIKVVTDKLDTALELDGAEYRYTTNALEQAPTGGSAPSAADIADAVWDEVLTGATHNDPTSAGRRLRQAAGAITNYEGTAQAGGATSITLDAGASSVTDFYVPGLVAILTGTGAGQSRRISAYNGTSKVATVSTAWATNPASDSEFVILPWASVRVSDIDANVVNASALAADAVAEIAAGVGASPTAEEIADEVLERTLTEDYAADGAEFSVLQALYMLWALLAERSIASTTLTAKKLDGSTSAMAFTLDDATTPTSQTRSA